jgi:hypothetical protein
MNTIYLQHNSTGKVSLGKSTIHVKDIADVSGSSTVVIVVTASKGIVQGMLMPGAISYRRPGSSIFQDIYAVNIQGTVEEVDVGASVVSRTKGLLYGHIILGAPGTSLAYMAPASHVLREIREKTGEDVSLDLRLLHTRDTVYNGAEYPRVQQWSSGVFRTQGSEFMDVETWVNKSRKPFDGALDVEIEDKVLLSNFSMKQAASTIKATVTTNQPIPRKSKTSTIRATLSSGSSPDDVRKTARAQCTLCDEFPDGFRGKHELRRHHKAKHSSTATRYVCRDPHTVGMLSPIRPGVPLAACQPCRNKKPYTAYYNAAAHLRRCHFNARGSGRNNRHSMADLRPWLEEIWLRDGLDQDIEVVIAGEEKKTNNGKDEADEENGRTVEEKCRAKEETSRADDEDTVSYICLDDAMSSAPYPIDPGFFSVEAEQMMLSDWPDAAEIIDVKSNVELKHDPSFTVDYDIFNSSHDSEFMHTTSPEYKTNTASTMDSSFAQDCETCFYSPSQDRWTDILPTSGEGDTPMFLHGCDDWELEVHQSVSTYVNGSLPPAITAETLVDLRLEKAKCSDG